MRKTVAVEGTKAGTPLDLAEIGSGSDGIEDLISEAHPTDDLELEAFMNEDVEILVHQDNREGALRVIDPMVNGSFQPIIRGVKTVVKRKYIEALARSYIESYQQRQKNPNDPSSLQMLPLAQISYPFEVLKDTPRGYGWLREITQR